MLACPLVFQSEKLPVSKLPLTTAAGEVSVVATNKPATVIKVKVGSLNMSNFPDIWLIVRWDVSLAVYLSLN
jgi:hypothetical protein